MAHRGYLRRLMALLAITAVVLATSLTRSSAAANDRAPIPDNVPSFVNHARKLGHTGPKSIDFVVGLRLRNRAQLDALLVAQRTPGSPEYGHFLSPAVFTQRFGPTPTDEAAVVDYLHSHGIAVRQTWPNHQLIDATGSVSQVEKAFGVQLDDYELNGATYYANATDPQVPITLAGTVQSVIGLDNYAALQPHHRPGTGAAVAPAGYSPQTIANAYDFATAYSNGLRGQGQSIAVATAHTYRASDVDSFWSSYSLAAPSIVNVPVDGTSRQIDVETTIDLERSGAMANGATIRMYLGASAYLSTFTDVFNKIVTDNQAKVATTSWGLCETGTGQATINTDDNIFAQGAAEGITFFAASGDSGSNDCQGSSTPAVDYPASDPYVTAAGGTTMTPKSGALGISSETAWSGSGGGSSAFFSKPAWQSGEGDSHRDVADVALDADPSTGYSVFYNGSWSVYGGTSFAAPEWAAIVALANQYRGDQGPIGQGGPALYRVATTTQPAAAFHDVTSGNNGTYSAGTGWDYPTGWGSTDVWNLVQDLAAQTASPTPTGTPTNTPMPTATSTPTNTPSAGATNTPTATPTPGPVAPPTNLAASAKPHHIILSWTASATSGATYNVYRSVTSGAELSSSPIATGVTGSSYNDPSVSRGTTYYYQMTAQVGAAQSAPSNEASAAAR